MNKPEETIETHPEGLLRVAIAAISLTIVLVLTSLLADAPLERVANPQMTPNPAKAPWYFLGLQELLHYFPPVVAGVIMPGLVVMALIVIPYFEINMEAEGFWLARREQKLIRTGVVLLTITILLIRYSVYPVMATTFLTGGAMLAGYGTSRNRFAGWSRSKPLSFWIMSWFLMTSVTLTVIGTFFRGAGWGWVWPWENG